MSPRKVVFVRPNEGWVYEMPEEWEPPPGWNIVSIESVASGGIAVLIEVSTDPDPCGR